MTRHALCRREELPVAEPRGFCLATAEGQHDILLLRQGDELHGYLNRCPHTGVNLDWAPGRFLDTSGRYLQCATHGALFRPHDGLCVHGPCVKQSLQRVPVFEVSGVLYVEI